MLGFLRGILPSKSDREVKRLWQSVAHINEVWESYQKLADPELPKKTEEFVFRIRDGEPLDDIMPEAFALVKEACRRLLGKKWTVTGLETTWDMVPFDVQLIGGMVLHQGRVAEMRTGEGKTLVATMPLYLNALDKKGAHLVTVNDYLALRDREWMGPVYESLGLTVGCIQQGMEPGERKPHYSADITYGTNNEFGFDYLRDNMVGRWQDKVQRGHHYAIVDEVDIILVDEARTPLIISGPVEAGDKGFDRLTPPVRRLFGQQNLLANRLVAEAEKLLAAGDETEAGIRLLTVRRGSPKNKKLTEMEQRQGVKSLIERTELNFIRDKRLHELDEKLYFAIDEKDHSVALTDMGRKELAPTDAEAFVLPELNEELARVDHYTGVSPQEKLAAREEVYRRYAQKSEMLHSLHALLKGFSLFERDVDYVVQEGRVVIVDEFTGRLMPGRRYSDGLHSALEAKENVSVQGDTQTFATITLQNYFRMYQKLAGMSGTAMTIAGELFGVYKLDVVAIPTNEPARRIDYPDVVHKTREQKYDAVVEEIDAWHQRGRPILVGTTSVDVSQVISDKLRRRRINHVVLNAKFHQHESEIIKDAGQAGAVTIATNMAGRGTDIKLGSGVVKGEGCYLVKPGDSGCAYWEEEPGRCNPDVPCGLYIIGTERHEARRIDDQLRGRSGRQGDPGSSRFFLSLEDDLMRLFGSERVARLMDRFGAKDDEPIEHPLVTRAIEGAQKRVEERNREIRRRLLEYDDVMNRQREAVYAMRDAVLQQAPAAPAQEPGAESESLSSEPTSRPGRAPAQPAPAGDDSAGLRQVYDEMVNGFIEHLIRKAALAGKSAAEWDWEGLRGELQMTWLADLELNEDQRGEATPETLRQTLTDIASRRYDERGQELGEKQFEGLCRSVFLYAIDTRWREHLYALDTLREGISLSAYGQKDPLVEYKRESFDLFQEMMKDLYKDALTMLFRVQVRGPEERRPSSRRPVRAYKPEAAGVNLRSPAEPARPTQARRANEKVGRNAPCPCGSGKKYKRCCGVNQPG
ncbi:preprotein translocase subunit SecA [candidate division WOR-3 bacterium]|nr:preprotein translocase subunit SecA [candidate division WOR-3 bacterium]